MNRWAGIALLAGVLACAVSPITGKIEPGDDPFVIGVGEGPDGNIDLFAAPANGGTFHRLTFSQPAEAWPVLDSTGTRVAFFRRYQDGKIEVVTLDLATMAESRWQVASADDDARLAWVPGHDSVMVVGPAGVNGAGAILLGAPAFARIARCDSTPGWCVRAAQGETQLPEEASEPMRWGPDAVAYRIGEGIEVRPLEGGRTRPITWTNRPKNLRQLTHHPGSAQR